MIGETLVHYEITSQIGRGGMGEVYQAKDTKLGRDVAIKVLPEEFALDTDRVARFQREAKLLASLNHPNIAAIYGLEKSEGTHFLVLELIEGQTLADRLKTGPVPVEEALKLALQMAEALEAAHEKGVIHRDLKPANIKVTPDGKVKVLDFGLAKAYAGDQENIDPMDSPTISAAATQKGVILGTAAYMSPEQAKGKIVDKRADIWAFGVILFEMLIGKSLFSGEDVSSTLARVLEREPDFSTLPQNLHFRIQLLLERCLEKEEKDRYGSISDARVDIQKVMADPDGVFAQPITATKRGVNLRLGGPWIAAALAFVAIVAALAGWTMKPPAPRPIMRFSYELPEGQQFSRLWNPLLAVSSDGSQLAYTTSEGLYLRSMERLDARLVSGTDENSANPFFSPDGQWLGYWSASEQQLKKIPISGGASVTLCEDTGLDWSARPWWSIDDTILYGQSEGIMKVSANGGTPELVVAREGRQLYAPQILPDGESVLFTILDRDETQIAVQSLKSGDCKILTSGINATYLPTGHIVYGLGNNLFIAPIDLDLLELAGGPIPIVEGVFWMGTRGAAPQYAISDAGTLAYISGGDIQTKSRILAWVDRNGRVDPLNAPAKAYINPRISPDGTKLAVQSIEADSDGVLWIYDLTKDRAIQKLTFEGNNYHPIWTPDSKYITFSSDREGAISIYRMATDRRGVAERLTTAEAGTKHWPESWSPDGKTLAFAVERDLYTDWDIYLVTPNGEAECLYDRPESFYMSPQFSPDGRWIAYAFGPAGGDIDLYVEPFPPTGARWQITEGGGRGTWPLWSPNGKELFYRPTTFSGQPIALKAVDVVTSPEFEFQNERTLPIEGFSTVSYHREFDITPDGSQFLITFPANFTEAAKSENRQINIVLNWFEELKQRVPVD